MYWFSFMRIAFSLYELEIVKPFNGMKARRGALLKVHFSDDLVGFADCHPWKEFSDEPIERQLDLLKNGQTTALTKRSLHFAMLDAKARLNKINLLENLKIPSSNYLVTDLSDVNSKEHLTQAMEDGFTTFKVKLGCNLEKELQFLKNHIHELAKLRLDFNLKLTSESFEDIIDKLKDLKLQIEYIEDPFSFDEHAWKKIQSHDGLTLACDFKHTQAIDKPLSSKVLIIKPAISEDPDVKDQKIVVTSYLDHPFGQCTAAYVAATYPNTTCGLLTHHFYKKNAFSEQLTTKGAEFKKPAGFGFGFDEQLYKLKWVDL